MWNSGGRLAARSISLAARFTCLLRYYSITGAEGLPIAAHSHSWGRAAPQCSALNASGWQDSSAGDGRDARRSCPALTFPVTAGGPVCLWGGGAVSRVQVQQAARLTGKRLSQTRCVQCRSASGGTPRALETDTFTGCVPLSPPCHGCGRAEKCCSTICAADSTPAPLAAPCVPPAKMLILRRLLAFVDESNRRIRALAKNTVTDSLGAS
jgi:hypothetical protein